MYVSLDSSLYRMLLFLFCVLESVICLVLEIIIDWIRKLSYSFYFGCIHEFNLSTHSMSIYLSPVKC